MLLIQEACCISQEVFNTWALELQAKGVISLSPRFNTRGTAICVGDKMDFEIERTHHCADDAGYAVAIDLCKNKISCRIISVHFPKEDTGRGHNFLDHLTDWLYFMAKTNKVLILGGDFNCVENTDLDSLHRKNKNSANKRFFIDFCQKLKLVDPFRELYPTKRSSLIVVHRIEGNPIGLVVMVDWISFILKKNVSKICRRCYHSTMCIIRSWLCNFVLHYQ